MAQTDRHPSPAANPAPNAQAGQTMATGTIFYSAFVAPGTYATTSYEGPMGSYVWEARVVDAEGNASPWQKFGSNTGADFVLSPIAFTYPSTGTTTPQFKNWLLNAKHVVPSHSYKLQVNWGHTKPNQATSSITTSGTGLLAGVSVPKTTYSVDYTDTGEPVAIVAEASLYDQTADNTLIAKSSINFFEKTIPAAANCDGSEIQCISYTYDANGNITRIEDHSRTAAAKTVDYVYDPLNRLVSAQSSHAANGENFTETYSYDALGNILSGPRGMYVYEGNQGESYANPHAVTSITNGSSTTNFTYDKNGNMTSGGDWTYGWDYRNRLISATNGSSTSSYGYDAMGQRVKMTENGITTIFVNPGYSVTGSTTVKHIFANGVVVATVTDNGTSSVTNYVHTDHLGGTNVVTDEAGNVVETMDYYPYGAARLDEKAESYAGEKRKYIGQEYDAATELLYLNARYYDSARGQFISQDPSFLALGNANLVKQMTGQDLQKYLADPQQLNSYAYGRGNPMTRSDPTGNASYIWNNGAGMTGIDTWDHNTYYQSQDQALSQSNADRMSSPENYGNLGAFYDLVHNGGEWDYKNKERAYYFSGDDFIDKEAFGNRNYGYAGTAGGFSLNLLKVGGGYAQVVSGNAQIQNAKTYFDDPKDTANIQIGVDSNKKSNPASPGQIAAQSANRQTLNLILNQLKSILIKLVK